MSKPTSCCKPFSIELLDLATGEKLVTLVPCGDWRNCEYCRNARRGKLLHRLMGVIEAIEGDEFLQDYYRVAMFTFTLDPKKVDVYSVKARDELAKAINRAKVELRRQINRQGGSIIMSFRVYEFHKSGAWHAHLVIVYPKRTKVATIAFESAYKTGFVFSHFGYQGTCGAGRRPAKARLEGQVVDYGSLVNALRYCCKYITKSLSGEVSWHYSKERTKGTRFFGLYLAPWLRAKAGITPRKTAKVLTFEYVEGSKRPVCTLVNRLRMLKIIQVRSLKQWVNFLGWIPYSDASQLWEVAQSCYFSIDRRVTLLKDSLRRHRLYLTTYPVLSLSLVKRPRVYESPSKLADVPVMRALYEPFTRRRKPVLRYCHAV